MDHFFSIRHLDGSVGVYDQHGRPAYLGFEVVPQIVLSPEPTQASGCAAANDAWNRGGQKAWQDLNIQAHMKWDLHPFDEKDLVSAENKWMKTRLNMQVQSKALCTNRLHWYAYGLNLSQVPTCPDCGRKATDLSVVRPQYDIRAPEVGTHYLYCRNCGVAHQGTLLCPDCGIVVDTGPA